ncbi:hypothetical protein CR513_15217, partial [Mucuna pruriens]
MPTIHWIDISMNLVLSLPRSKTGKDFVFVVVEKFSKRAHFIPCHKSDDGYYVANLFFREVVRFHALPKTISKLSIKLLFSTVFHPQTDGRTKVTNRTLSQLLKCFVDKSMKTWEEWLPYIEFSYNKVVNSTTFHTPFELVYGFNLLPPLDLLSLPNVNTMLNYDSVSKGRLSNMLRRLTKEKFKKFLKNEGKVSLRKSKLYPREYDPFKVLKKINSNAYVLYMPYTYEGNSNLRSNSFQEGEPGIDLDSIQKEIEEEKSDLAKNIKII